MSRRYDRLAVFWEMPLALASFLFYKAVRAVMRRLLRIQEARSNQENRGWQFLSRDFLARPGILPLVMARGPRWNTHAVIGMLASGMVQKAIEIDADAANRSAGSWTIVVATHPGQKTVTSVGSLSPSFPAAKARLELPSGKYWLSLRYYHWRRDGVLPAVKVDGRDVAKPVPIPSDANDFYRDLRSRSNFYYGALHYYVFVLLRYRRWFPASFVEREFLPVGNPDTEFYFEALRRGDRLELRVAPEALADWDVFVTSYDRASFPTESEQVTAPRHEIAAREGDRMCLIRVQRRIPGPKEYRREWVQTALS
jgi:hypothetical protein